MTVEFDAIPRPGTGFRAKRRKVSVREKLARLAPGGHTTLTCTGAIRNRRHYAHQVARTLGFRIATRRWGPKTIRAYRLPDPASPEEAK